MRGVAAGALGLALFVLGAPGEGRSQPEPSQKPTFRAGVDLVSVTVVVRDRRGRPVRHLSREDFEVLDGGIRRRIVDFQTDHREPVSLALLLDASGSMALGGRQAAARELMHHLLSAFEPGQDEAGLFSFDSALREVQVFTSDIEKVRAAAGRVESFGATSLYDAIAGTAERVAARAEVRRAVVVITDGVDTSSRLSPGEVSGVASAIDVPIYVIVIGSTRGRQERSPPEGELRNLTYWTGGDLFVVETSAEGSVAARRVLTELRHQYLIAFESAIADGWRYLQVRTRARDLEVRARSGYLAGGARRLSDPVGAEIAGPVSHVTAGYTCQETERGGC